MFRMSAFFLIAGFFARLVVERRGVKTFVKDRGKRVAVPLFLFGPVVLIMFPVGLILGALPHGLDTVQALAQPPVCRSPGNRRRAAKGGYSPTCGSFTTC